MLDGYLTLFLRFRYDLEVDWRGGILDFAFPSDLWEEKDGYSCVFGLD